MSRAGIASGLDTGSSASSSSSSLILVIISVAVAVLLLICLVACFIQYRKKKKREKEEQLVEERGAAAAVTIHKEEKQKKDAAAVKGSFWSRFRGKEKPTASEAKAIGGLTTDVEMPEKEQMLLAKQQRKQYERQRKMLLEMERKRRVAERGLPCWWQSPAITHTDSSDTSSDSSGGRPKKLKKRHVGVPSGNTSFKSLGSFYPSPHDLRKQMLQRAQEQHHTRGKKDSKKKSKRDKGGDDGYASTDGQEFLSDGGIPYVPTSRKVRYRPPEQLGLPVERINVVSSLPKKMPKFRVMDPPAEIGCAAQVVEQRLPLASGRDFVAKHYDDFKHKQMFSVCNPLHRSSPLKESDEPLVDSDGEIIPDFGGHQKPTMQQSTALLALQAASVRPFDENVLARPANPQLRKMVRGCLPTTKKILRETSPEVNNGSEKSPTRENQKIGANDTVVLIDPLSDNPTPVVFELQTPPMTNSVQGRTTSLYVTKPAQPLSPYLQDDDL